MSEQEHWALDEIRDHYAANVCDCVNHGGGCEAENRFDRMIAQVRREAAAEQREKDAQAAERFGAPEPSRRFSPEHWDAWREHTSVSLAAVIREQGTEHE